MFRVVIERVRVGQTLENKLGRAFYVGGVFRRPTCKVFQIGLGKMVPERGGRDCGGIEHALSFFDFTPTPPGPQAYPKFTARLTKFRDPQCGCLAAPMPAGCEISF